MRGIERRRKQEKSGLWLEQVRWIDVFRIYMYFLAPAVVLFMADQSRLVCTEHQITCNRKRIMKHKETSGLWWRIRNLDLWSCKSISAYSFFIISSINLILFLPLFGFIKWELIFIFFLQNFTKEERQYRKCRAEIKQARKWGRREEFYVFELVVRWNKGQKCDEVIKPLSCKNDLLFGEIIMRFYCIKWWGHEL